jgi:hypothetical protein
MQIDLLEFEATVVVDSVTVVNSKGFKPELITSATDKEGNPVEAYTQRSFYTTVASIRCNNVCMTFSDLNNDFQKMQPSGRWKPMFLSFNQESDFLLVSGIAYTRQQHNEMLDFIENYFNMIFQIEKAV